MLLNFKLIYRVRVRLILNTKSPTETGYQIAGFQIIDKTHFDKFIHSYQGSISIDTDPGR